MFINSLNMERKTRFFKSLNKASNKYIKEIT